MGREGDAQPVEDVEVWNSRSGSRPPQKTCFGNDLKNVESLK